MCSGRIEPRAQRLLHGARGHLHPPSRGRARSVPPELPRARTTRTNTAPGCGPRPAPPLRSHPPGPVQDSDAKLPVTPPGLHAPSPPPQTPRTAVTAHPAPARRRPRPQLGPAAAPISLRRPGRPAPAAAHPREQRRGRAGAVRSGGPADATTAPGTAPAAPTWRRRRYRAAPLPIQPPRPFAPACDGRRGRQSEAPPGAPTAQSAAGEAGQGRWPAGGGSANQSGGGAGARGAGRGLKNPFCSRRRRRASGRP